MTRGFSPFAVFEQSLNFITRAQKDVKDTKHMRKQCGKASDTIPDWMQTEHSSLKRQVRAPDLHDRIGRHAQQP